MQGNPIQWFPGHMAKTRRRIREDLKLVDAVVELLDARIPISSKNPDIQSILGNKPTLTLLNKSSLADPVVTEKWIAAIRKENGWAAAIDCSTGEGINKIVPILTSMLSDKITRWRERGMVGRKIKVMVVGIPNVGKSTFINKLAGARKAKAEDRPGVTRDTQWVEVDKKGTGLLLLDTPGVLWPKFEDKTIGENLAITGAIRDGVLDLESIAAVLCGRLRAMYPDALCARYGLSEISTYADMTDYELLLEIGRRRGFLLRGGEIDSERTASVFLDEFRAAKIGRISLEVPYDVPDTAEVDRPGENADDTVDKIESSDDVNTTDTENY